MRPSSFSFQRPWIERVLKKLKGHLAAVSISSVLIGMESTASYHVNLFSYLVSEGYKVLLINPLLISNYVKMQLRKTKTDKKDAVVIAQFLLTNGATLVQRATPSLISDLRDLPVSGRAWLTR